jgi:hypothetical protein
MINWIFNTALGLYLNKRRSNALLKQFENPLKFRLLIRSSKGAKLVTGMLVVRVALIELIIKSMMTREN